MNFIRGNCCGVSFEELEAWDYKITVAKIATLYVLDEGEIQILIAHLLAFFLIVFDYVILVKVNRLVLFNDEVCNVDIELDFALFDHVDFISMVLLLVENIAG